MELHEFHIGKIGTRPCRERNPLTEIAHRIGGRIIKPADPAGGEYQPCSRKNGGPAGCGRAVQAGDALAIHQNPSRLETFEHGDGRRPRHSPHQRFDDCRTRAIAFSMDDAAAIMGRFQSEREFSGFIAVEADSGLFQRCDGCRRLRNDAGGDTSVAEPVAG